MAPASTTNLSNSLPLQLTKIINRRCRCQHIFLFSITIIFLLLLTTTPAIAQELCSPGFFTYPPTNTITCGAQLSFGEDFGLGTLPLQRHIPFTITTGLDPNGNPVILPLENFVVPTEQQVLSPDPGTVVDSTTNQNTQSLNDDNDNNDNNDQTTMITQANTNTSTTANITIYNLQKRIGIDNIGQILSGTIILTQLVSTEVFTSFTLNMALTNSPVQTTNYSILVTSRLPEKPPTLIQTSSGTIHVCQFPLLTGVQCQLTIQSVSSNAIIFQTTTTETLSISLSMPIGVKFSPIGLKFYTPNLISITSPHTLLPAVAGTLTETIYDTLVTSTSRIVKYTFTIHFLNPAAITDRATAYIAIVDSNGNSLMIPNPTSANAATLQQIVFSNQLPAGTPADTPIYASGTPQNIATCPTPLTFGPKCDIFVSFQLPGVTTVPGSPPLAIPINAATEYSIFSPTSLATTATTSPPATGATAVGPQTAFNNLQNSAGGASISTFILSIKCGSTIVNANAANIELYSSQIITGSLFFAHTTQLTPKLPQNPLFTEESPLLTLDSCQFVVHTSLYIDSTITTHAETQWSLRLPYSTTIPTRLPTLLMVPDFQQSLSKRYPYQLHQHPLSTLSHGEDPATTTPLVDRKVKYLPTRAVLYPGEIFYHFLTFAAESDDFYFALDPYFNQNGIDSQPIRIAATAIPIRVSTASIAANEYSLIRINKATKDITQTGYTLIVPKCLTTSVYGYLCQESANVVSEYGISVRTSSSIYGINIPTKLQTSSIWSPITFHRTTYHDPSPPFNQIIPEPSTDPSSASFHHVEEAPPVLNRVIEYYDFLLVNTNTLFLEIYQRLPAVCTRYTTNNIILFTCNCEQPGQVGLTCEETLTLTAPSYGPLIAHSTDPKYQSLDVTSLPYPPITPLAGDLLGITSFFEKKEMLSIYHPIDTDTGLSTLNAAQFTDSFAQAVDDQYVPGIQYQFPLLMMVHSPPLQSLDYLSFALIGYKTTSTVAYIEPLGQLCTATTSPKCLPESFICPQVAENYFAGINCDTIVHQFTSNPLEINFIDQESSFTIKIIGPNHFNYPTVTLYHVDPITGLQLITSASPQQPEGNESKLPPDEEQTSTLFTFDLSATRIALIDGDSYMVYVTDPFGVNFNIPTLYMYRIAPKTSIKITQIEENDRYLSITLSCPLCIQIYQDSDILLYYRLQLIDMASRNVIDTLSISAVNPSDKQIYTDLYEFPFTLGNLNDPTQTDLSATFTLDIRQRFQTGGQFILSVTPSTIIEPPITIPSADLDAIAVLTLSNLYAAMLPTRCNNVGRVDLTSGECICNIGYFGPACQYSTIQQCPLASECPPYQIPNTDCTECICITEVCRQFTRTALLNVAIVPARLDSICTDSIFSLRTILTDRVEIELSAALGINKLPPRLSRAGDTSLESMRKDPNNIRNTLPEPIDIDAIPPPVSVERLHIRTIPSLTDIIALEASGKSIPLQINLIITLSMEPIMGQDEAPDLSNPTVVNRFDWLNTAYTQLVQPTYLDILTTTPYWKTASSLQTSNRLILGSLLTVTSTTPFRQLRLQSPLVMTTCLHQDAYTAETTRYVCPTPSQRTSPLWSCGNYMTPTRARGALQLSCDILDPSILQLSSDEKATAMMSTEQQDCPMYPREQTTVICNYQPAIPAKNEAVLSDVVSHSTDIYFGEPFALQWSHFSPVLSSANLQYYQIAVYFVAMGSDEGVNDLDYFLDTVPLSQNPAFITPSITSFPSKFSSQNVRIKIVLLQNAAISAVSTKAYTLNPPRFCSSSLNMKCANNLTCQLDTQQCGCPKPYILTLPPSQTPNNPTPATQNPAFGQCISPCVHGILNDNGVCDCTGTSFVGEYCQIPLNCNPINTSTQFGSKLPQSSNICTLRGFDTGKDQCGLQGSCECINYFDSETNCGTCGIIFPYSSTVPISRQCDAIGTNIAKTNENCSKCICKLGYGGPQCQYRAMLGTIRSFKQIQLPFGTKADQYVPPPVDQAIKDRIVLDMTLSLGLNVKYLDILLIQQVFLKWNSTLVHQITFSIQSSTRAGSQTQQSSMSIQNENQNIEKSQQFLSTTSTTTIWDDNYNDLYIQQLQESEPTDHLHIFVDKSSPNSSPTTLSTFTTQFSSNAFQSLALSQQTPSLGLAPTIGSLYDIWDSLQQSYSNVSPIGNTQAGDSIGSTIVTEPGYDPVCVPKTTPTKNIASNQYVFKKQQSNKAIFNLFNLLQEGLVPKPDDPEDVGADPQDNRPETPDQIDNEPMDNCPTGPNPTDSLLPSHLGSPHGPFPTVEVVVSVVVIGGSVVGLLVALYLMKQKKVCCFVPVAQNNNRSRKGKSNKTYEASTTPSIQTASTELSTSTISSRGYDGDVESNTHATKTTAISNATTIRSQTDFVTNHSNTPGYHGIQSATCASNTCTDTDASIRSNNSAPIGAVTGRGIEAPLGSDDVPLPAGWRRLYDPYSKRHYFINDTEMQTSWNHPSTNPNSIDENDW